MVKDEIYRLLASDPSYMMSYSEATEKGIEAVLNYMRTLACYLQWDYSYTTHPDEEGATVSICWIDDGQLELITLTYRNY